MGYTTAASCDKSTAMGNKIEASEDEALVNPGSIHGKNLGFVADQRLTEDARPANTTALLGTVNALKAFTHAPSANCCAHRNWTRADCAGGHGPAGPAGGDRAASSSQHAQHAHAHAHQTRVQNTAGGRRW